MIKFENSKNINVSLEETPYLMPHILHKKREKKWSKNWERQTLLKTLKEKKLLKTDYSNESNAWNSETV